MNKIPSFFTFFRSGADDDNLIIPKAFIERMEESFPEKVFLRNRDNYLWTVKVVEVGQYWRLVNGWENFVIDNSLETRDLLVFSYVQRNILNVKLYGPCGTEKNITGPSTRRDDDDDDENQMTESEDSDQEYKRDRQVVMRNVNNDGFAGNNRRERRPLQSLYPKCYGMEIFKAGLAEKPINPYFVAQLSPNRRTYLPIPSYVIKDYHLTLGQEITLVDPVGRKFPSKCKQRSGRRLVILGGWLPLCIINVLNNEDKCICEFVQREADHRQFLYINFVRSNV